MAQYRAQDIDQGEKEVKKRPFCGPMQEILPRLFLGKSVIPSLLDLKQTY